MVFLALALVSPASAADPATALSDAETVAASAAADVSEAESNFAPAEARYQASAKRAEPVDRAAASAKESLRGLEADSAHSQEIAQHRVSELEAAHSEDAEDHDDAVTGGIAFALAALLVAAIALSWSWFRASAAVAWLVGLGLWPAVGACLGGGIVLLVAGGSILGAGGIAGVIGALVGFLGLILPVALLLARHSAQVQSGRSKPLLKRERLPSWVPLTVAAVGGLIFLASLATAVFAPDPQPTGITAQMRERASGTVSPSLAARITAAKRQADQLAEKASELDGQRSAAQRELVEIRTQLRGSRRRLASAESDIDFYGERLAAISAQEGREAEAEAELVAEEEAEAAAEECNPNYSGCLDPYSSDYDCEGGSGDGPDYTGTVEVIGYDEYGLDANGNGIGCEE